uniref:MPN domain-containing protein n=1 Tax=Parascaris equorum TaxID=6256 RepID=A0A914RCR0_PAREQ
MHLLDGNIGEMASTLTVKVHPVVYLTIVDAYERRSNKPGANDKALGTCLSESPGRDPGMQVKLQVEMVSTDAEYASYKA